MGITQRTEELILNQLIYNENYYRKVFPHLKEDYFQERIEKLIFECIRDYGSKYSISPDVNTVSILVNEKEGINEDEINEINEYIYSEDLEIDEDMLRYKIKEWMLARTNIISTPSLK